MTKINLRVISKCHAHLQSLTKTPVKFQKARDKMKEELSSQSIHLNDGRTDAQTWATLNALLHSSNGGDKMNQVTNGPVNAHLTSEQFLNTKLGDKRQRDF